MRNALFGLILTISTSSLLYSQTRDSCADLNQAIKGTYNFRPALLANQAERDSKSEIEVPTDPSSAS